MNDVVTRCVNLNSCPHKTKDNDVVEDFNEFLPSWALPLRNEPPKSSQNKRPCVYV